MDIKSRTSSKKRRNKPHSAMTYSKTSRCVALLSLALLVWIFGTRWQRWGSQSDKKRWHERAQNAAVYVSRSYVLALKSHPLQVKCATAFVLFAASDLLAQSMVSQGLPNVYRVLRFALWGALAAGPLLHIWYNFLNNFFNGFNSIGVWQSAILMSIINELIFTPAYINLYFLFDALSQGQSHVDAYLKVRF